MKTTQKSIHKYFTQLELDRLSGKWETLEDFMQFYSNWPPPVPMAPPENGVYIDDIVYGVVMLRVKQYQCQLFICKPNTVIPEHRHPHADSSEVHISGMMFNKRGRQIITQEILDIRTEDGLEYPHGRAIKIACTDRHKATCGPRGGAFLVFQKWHEGHLPDSLGIEWDGEGVGTDHEEMIEERKVHV